MSARLVSVQVGWQAGALRQLLSLAGSGAPYGRGPWIPAYAVVTAVQEIANCSSQAATGALRALRTVGLADSCETAEGMFWKATDAACRADVLLTDREAE